MKFDIRLTATAIDKLLKELVIIVDSRENENQYIIDYFEKKKIKYIQRKLDYGDYSCMLEKNVELGIPFDISFENNIAIEKKSSGGGISEIASNFTTGRQAFENEFIRASHFCDRVYLLIENGSFKDIISHNYRSGMDEKALMNSLLSWEYKYDFHIHFVDKEDMAVHIHRLLYIGAKKTLSN